MKKRVSKKVVGKKEQKSKTSKNTKEVEAA